MSKKAKKKPAKRRVRKARETILDKIHRIRDRVPHIEPTGECIDENTGDVLFRFTEAQYVFDVYRTQCDLEGLQYRPYFDKDIQPKVIAVGNMPMLIGTFCIEDRKTGERIVGWGAGMGRNLDWSGNTAATRALKQFLLTTFEARWQDPENPLMTREQIKAQVIQELGQDGTLSRIEQIKFWAENLGKKKGESDASTKGKNTEGSAGSGDKKNRKGKKRHNRNGKRTASKKSG